MLHVENPNVFSNESITPCRNMSAIYGRYAHSSAHVTEHQVHLWDHPTAYPTGRSGLGQGNREMRPERVLTLAELSLLIRLTDSSLYMLQHKIKQ